MEAAKGRRQDEYNRDVTQAWHIVRFYAEMRSQKRMPDLKKYLAGASSAPPLQSVGEQRATLAMLSAQYGYPVKWGKAQ